MDQGWAIGDVEVPKPGRYTVSCVGLDTVLVSSAALAATPLGSSAANSTDAVLVPLAADKYGTGHVKAAIDVTAAGLRAGLREGARAGAVKNGGGSSRGGVVTLFVPLRAKVSARFGCTLEGPVEAPLKSAKAKAKTKGGSGGVSSSKGSTKKRALVQAWPPPWMPDLVGSGLMGTAHTFGPSNGKGAPFAVPVFNPSRHYQALVSARVTSIRDDGVGARRVAVSLLSAASASGAEGSPIGMQLSVAPGQATMLPLLLTVASDDASDASPSALAPCTPLHFDMVLSFAQPQWQR